MTENWLLHDIEHQLKRRNNAVVHRDYSLTGKDIKVAIYDDMVPSWTKKGIQLHPLDWPDNQVYDKGDIEKIPSWTQKSTHLLRKKAWYCLYHPRKGPTHFFIRLLHSLATLKCWCKSRC
jgi:hypothetical protein